MPGLTLDNLDLTYAPGAGRSGHTLLYPPDCVAGIAPVDLNTSMGTLQRQLFQQNQVLHSMKDAFHAQVLSLQAEQQRVQQDNVHVLHRLNTLPTPLSPGSPSRLDCPTFGSEDETVGNKLGLHDFHAWACTFSRGMQRVRLLCRRAMIRCSRSYKDVRRVLSLRRCHWTRFVLIKAFKGCSGY